MNSIAVLIVVCGVSLYNEASRSSVCTAAPTLTTTIAYEEQHVMANAILRKIRARASAGFGFYTYILSRPNGEPFYVGKGSDRRVFNHERDARSPKQKNHPSLNVIRKIWREDGVVTLEIHSWHKTAAAAYKREAVLVRQIGLKSEGKGPLYNLRQGGSGGDGSNLMRWRQENPEAYAASKKKATERQRSSEYRRAVSDRVRKEFAEDVGRAKAMSNKAHQPDAIERRKASILITREESPHLYASAIAKATTTKRSDEFRKSAAQKTKAWIESHREEFTAIQTSEATLAAKSAGRLKWVRENPERAAEIAAMAAQGRRLAKERRNQKET